MRDIAVTAVVFALLPFILKDPRIGIYTWSWLGYMNPHRLAYGFAFSFPFAQIVALVTMASIVMYKGPKSLRMNWVVGLWIAFLVWVSITTLLAMYPDAAYEQYIKILKIQLVIFLTMMLIRTKRDIDILVWVIVLSIGYYGIKGGAFTIATGGGYRVWGPAGSFIEDNNSLALASLMIMPLMYYLYLQDYPKIVKQFLVVSMILVAFSSLGSQSRGALLGFIATGAYLWWQLPKKFASGLVIALLGITLLIFMPESWYERMNTIGNYQEDESAMGRIEAWKLAINVANHRFFGAGLNPWFETTYLLYQPEFQKARAAHSIYFSILCEHGWIGLMLFLSVFYGGWRISGQLVKAGKETLELKWCADLGRMLKVCFVAYGSGGAFLSLSYFDLPWHLVSIAIIAYFCVQEHQKEQEKLQAKKAKEPEENEFTEESFNNPDTFNPNLRNY